NGSSWRFITKRHSSPTEPAPLQRQRTNPFASGGKYGVGDRRQSGRQRWLTQTCWRIVGLAPIHLDLRRLSHADQRMVVEVRLLDSAVCQRDLLPQMAHSLDDPAKGDVLSRGRVNDLATNIACSPDLVHCHLIAFVNAYIRDLGEVTQMTEPC